MATILVVDDAAFIRSWCGRVLAEAGHQVLEAENGARAVDIYRQRRPDAVILDVTMPIMDGLSALRRIRELDPDARVAMLTVQGEKEVVVAARRLGVRDFVLKPSTSPRLLAAVDRLLA